MIHQNEIRVTFNVSSMFANEADIKKRKFEASEIMFTPDENSGKVLKRFKKLIEEKYHVILDDYWDLHKWSVEHIPQFWSEMWDFAGIVYSKKYDEVVDLSANLWEVEWFRGARLNFAENLLKFRDDRVAIIVAGEGKAVRRITYKQLFQEAGQYAAAFRKTGLRKGDVVACYMSNRPEAIFAMLGAVSVGAVWTGVLPVLGPEICAKKLCQTRPKVFITIDSFVNNKQKVEMVPKIEKVVSEMPSLERVIILSSKGNPSSSVLSRIKNSISLSDFLSLGKEEDGSVPEMRFEQVSVSHPVFINFTSGTTGTPKALIHGSGCLLSIVRDFVLHPDGGENTVWFSASPVGWVTWAMSVSLYSTGCSVVLYEGVPFWLEPEYRVWDMVDEFGITHLFLPASILEEFQSRGHVPLERNHLNSLKYLIGVGSVVKNQTYDFMYEHLPKHVQFSSSFGCTELLGSCMMSESTLPVCRGEINAVTLANEVRALDDDGKEVFGEIGDLIMTTPTPNMMVGLWGDHDHSLLRDKYFSMNPDFYPIGDYGIINPVSKGIRICCRSDETLNQRGCRFGSSEIYNVVDRFPEVLGSLCVAHFTPDFDERAVLFLRMRQQNTLDGELQKRIREAIARELTDRHVPDIIIETPDIPMSFNGKKVEIIVKKIINKIEYDSSIVRNPESLDFYTDVIALLDDS